MSLLIFILVLSILIIVHEFGHFIIAKRIGVKVERFALGFGPKIASFKRKETEYAICLVPLGGYVKMAGDNFEEFKGKPNEYLSRTPLERSRIVFFGPVLNYVLGFVCFFFVFLLGFPQLTSKVGGLIKDYPASIAGIKVGDEIIAIDAKKIKTWDELQANIRRSRKESLEMIVLRDKKELPFIVNLRREKIKNIFGQEETINLVGIKSKDEIIYIKYGIIKSLNLAFSKIVEITFITFKALFRMVTGAMSFRDSVTGPLGIFYITQKAAHMGFNSLLHVVAVLSTSLGIFNLLPLPLLDGGHLFLLGFEKIKGRPIGKKVDEIITRVGFSLIIFLALFVFYNDLARFGILDKILKLFK
ncbi:MAG: RIP metalloprotease RseP [Candidatus Omnitrophota bacterium]|nr:RIP metalloprotease RseP [Candidatus Omnitrophota bacterium]